MWITGSVRWRGIQFLSHPYACCADLCSLLLRCTFTVSLPNVRDSSLLLGLACHCCSWCRAASQRAQWEAQELTQWGATTSTSPGDFPPLMRDLVEFFNNNMICG